MSEREPRYDVQMLRATHSNGSVTWGWEIRRDGEVFMQGSPEFVSEQDALEDAKDQMLMWQESQERGNVQIKVQRQPGKTEDASADAAAGLVAREIVPSQAPPDTSHLPKRMPLSEYLTWRQTQAIGNAMSYESIMHQIDSQVRMYLSAKKTPAYVYISDAVRKVLVDTIRVTGDALIADDETAENFHEYWKTHPLGHIESVAGDLTVLEIPAAMVGQRILVSDRGDLNDLAAKFKAAQSEPPPKPQLPIDNRDVGDEV